MVATHHNIYESLVEFIADVDAQKVLAFHASLALQERVEGLIEKKKETALDEREQEELEHYFILEHIVRLTKSRTRLKLKATA